MTNDDNDPRKMSDEQLVKILVEAVLRGEDVGLEADGTNASALRFLSRVAFVRDWCSICSYELNYGKELMRFAVLDRRTSTLVLLGHKCAAALTSGSLSGAAWTSWQGSDERNYQASAHGCD